MMDAIPCKDCITYAICRNQYDVKPNYEIGPFLTRLGHKCCLLTDYILLKDLGLKIPPDSMPDEERKYFTVPQCKRIIALFNYMGWNEKRDMAYYYDIAYPDGKIGGK